MMLILALLLLMHSAETLGQDTLIFPSEATVENVATKATIFAPPVSTAKPQDSPTSPSLEAVTLQDEGSTTSPVTTEQQMGVTETDKDVNSNITYRECTKAGEKCKPPAACALYFAESTLPQTCDLRNIDSVVPSTGLCCPDVITNRVQAALPAEASGSEVRPDYELDQLSPVDLAAGSDDGATFIKELGTIEKRLGKLEALKLKEKSPAAGHLKVVTSTEDARKLALHALQLAAATKALKTRLGLEDPEGELRQVNVQDTRLGASCPPLPNCPSRLTKYRNHDGTCNNPRRPWLGRAMSPTQRLLPAHYDDGVQAPRVARDGGSLPSAREVSLALSVEGHRAPQDRKLTALVADFGQFIDHDLTLSPVFQLQGGGGIQCCEQDGSGPVSFRLRHPQCLPIEIPRDDPFFSRFRQRCMNFVRTMVAPHHNCSLGAINQMDSVTHWLDASMIYGSDGRLARSLVGPRGTLQTAGPRGPSALLPSQNGACTQRNNRENPNFCFRSGDNRVNEQPVLTSMTTIWVREHNRVATILANMHPEWSDDGVYQEARRIVVAELQHITYNEFLPVLLGRKFMETYGMLPLTEGHSKDYNENYDASITNEFSGAAYRLHTLVRGVLRFTDHRGESQRLRIRDTLNSPQTLLWPDAGDALLRGQTSRHLGAFDSTFTDELTDHLFQVTNGGFGLDLFALNVQRGRDHGLSGYNAYRKLCGLPRARGFQDLDDTVKPEAIQALRNLYRDVEDIDLYAGGLSERRSSGSLLGHTFLCLVGDMFARLKKGDRFFYDLENQPSSFSNSQLTEIRKVSLARIICDNSPSIIEMQPLVFWQSDETRNAVVSCESPLIPAVSFSPWNFEFSDAKNIDF